MSEERKIPYRIQVDRIVSEATQNFPMIVTTTYEHGFPGGKLVLVESKMSGKLATSLVFVPDTKG